MEATEDKLLVLFRARDERRLAKAKLVDMVLNV